MEPEPKFLCDEMLGRLARYLRAAGYDTALAGEGEPDSALLRRANAEGRWFLTRDRRILEHKAAQPLALLLPVADLDGMAAALAACLRLDWLHRPFTRCLVDNTPLVAASDEHRPKLPKDVPLDGVLHCPACGRLYWAGSHHRRMRARLTAWAKPQAS